MIKLPGKLEIGILASEQRPMLRFLVILTAASTMGLQGYTILFNNFAAEVVRLDGSQVGITQSVREIPGLLTLLVVFVLLFVREHRLAALSVALLGLGTAMTALIPSYAWVIFTTVVMSFGFHYYDAGVVVVFLVYAFSSSKNLVMFMYILDNVLYNFEVAIRTYFQKVADPADIASSMSVGFTINHIAAVFLPALGGYFWMIDYRIPFIAGSALGLVSLVAAQWMRVPDKGELSMTTVSVST